jgi:hypothetical protein
MYVPRALELVIESVHNRTCDKQIVQHWNNQEICHNQLGLQRCSLFHRRVCHLCSQLYGVVELSLQIIMFVVREVAQVFICIVSLSFSNSLRKCIPKVSFDAVSE